MQLADLHNHLAVVQPATVKQPFLVKLQKRKKRLTGIVQNNSAAVEPDVVEISDQDILCVFMHDNPPPGQVYKCKVEPFNNAMDAKPWGRIFFYRGLAEAEKDNLVKALNQVYKKFIKPNKLRYLLPITLEIRPNTGSMQGYYRSEKKGVEHAICLCPISFVTGGHKDLQSLIVHEVGHPLHKIYMPDAIKQKWVSLYSTFNVLKELTTTDLQTARENLISSGSLPSEYKKNLQDDEKVVFSAILKYISTAHHLKVDHLDLLVAQKNSNLEKYWPKSKLHLSEMQSPISKYSNKSPTELFCESLAAYYDNATIPIKVKKLVRKSIAAMQPK